ncbi:hypothetical protein ARMSODRAFT_596379 [Armillaria solidipes]|uniref:Uncharacterized protein n=1 Tax=Armillaria solidipes TaxID=1076256 RepID=A0A2H3BUM4_9AGAR|nr:hypothetical protein ARMSODRAFT_596379 [Armillaria solidipes]
MAPAGWRLSASRDSIYVASFSILQSLPLVFKRENTWALSRNINFYLGLRDQALQMSRNAEPVRASRVSILITFVPPASTRYHSGVDVSGDTAKHAFYLVILMYNRLGLPRSAEPRKLLTTPVKTRRPCVKYHLIGSSTSGCIGYGFRCIVFQQARR